MSIRQTPVDAFPTATSQLQAETEAVLLKHAPGNAETPNLDRNAHVQFLARNLIQGFPARYTSQDASQPWLMFWTLQAFSILQVGLDPGNKQRAIDTILTWQHPDGGFGGGPGQAAHLLPTYAAVCALAVVGRPGPNGGWDQIDRQKLYSYFMSLKQPDGSFLVSHDAEVDARGIYCLLATAVMLDLMSPELIEGTAEFVASCQTYEGGFSSSSQPYFSPSDGSPILMSSPRPALGEAHGGYTFCSIASWIILQPFMSQADNAPTINTSSLLRWLVHMQGIEAELGGFKGRTNKLVDGCYSWWVGGSFSLLEALGVGKAEEGEDVINKDDQAEDWKEVDDALLNRMALQEYILRAGQHPAGGLRDKPPKGSDSYHTLYCLAGLSSAQHRVSLSISRKEAIEKGWIPSQTSQLPDTVRRRIFLDALSWAEEEGASKCLGGSKNRVNATHPLFNLTFTHSDALLAHFYGQTLPPRTRGSG